MGAESGDLFKDVPMPEQPGKPSNDAAPTVKTRMASLLAPGDTVYIDVAAGVTDTIQSIQRQTDYYQVVLKQNGARQWDLDDEIEVPY